MPFKSDKQRKWMHANEPEMAKKWEKEESINEANASVIRKKLLKQFGDDPLYKDFIIAKTPKEQKKALKTLKSIRGFNAVRLMQKYVKKLQEESIREEIRGIIKRELEATTTSAVSPYDTPLAFSKSTQRAIDVDDEDDEDEILGGQRKESFPVESISEAPMATRATLNQLNSKLNKASETIIKIIDKYKKKADVDGMVKIWMRGLHLRLKKSGIKIESINEKVAKPFSEHLRKAQDEIEYMISHGPTPDGDDGVYDKPREAMKLLQIAQKSLGKIK